MNPEDIAAIKLQAEHEIPKRWYENFPVAPAAVTGAAAAATFFQEKYLSIGLLPEHLGGLAIYSAGTLADWRSTKHGFEVSDLAVDNGFQPIYEHNSLLSSVTNLSEYQVATKKTSLRLVELIGAIASAVVTPVALGLGSGRLVAAANNNRVARRKSRQIEILAESGE